MKLVHAERLGEAFDSQLVIGVRESYGENHSNTAQLTLQTSALCDDTIRGNYHDTAVNNSYIVSQSSVFVTNRNKMSLKK